jgi:5-formyltetrahydrofolate cyclo-ligase
LTDPDTLLARAKTSARSKALAARQGCDPSLGRLLGEHLLAEFPPPERAVVSGFWPIGDEIDIRPLLEVLHARGHRIALPETPKRGNPLIFRQWWPGIAMHRERFGTSRPDGPQIEPTFLLLPLLAFDNAGRRLGYGGGYYDRTLAALPRATAVGCGYAAQQLDEVPAGDYDARLHAVATETGVIVFERP